MSKKVFRDVDLFTFDANSQTYRKVTKGELSGLSKIVSKAADYTILDSAQSGTVFMATAAAVFTLPSPTGKAGCVFTFINGADAAMGVKTAAVDTLIADGDLTADSLTCQTVAHMIGGRIEVFCNGTSWFAFTANVGCTGTIGT